MMKLFAVGSIFVSSLVAVGIASTIQAQSSGSFTGTVERVWEDGFRLNAGDRVLRVDSWDLCGDHTTSYVSVGDRLTVTGEFELRDFDAFSITTSDGLALCRA